MAGGARQLGQRIVPAACAAALCLPTLADAARPTTVSSAGAQAGAPLLDRRAGPRAGGPGAPARVRKAREALRGRFGAQLVLGVDPDTGATRKVQRLDGALTPPSEDSPTSVARNWVNDNRAVLGLDTADVDGLLLAEQRTAGPSGLTTVRFAQRLRGVELFGGGLSVTLDRGRRVLAAVGEPVADPAVATVRPELDADAARRALATDVGPTETLREPVLTLFPAADGIRLGWRLLEQRDSMATYAAVVDARTGALLLRQNLTTSAAPARYSPNYPGAEDHPVTGTANTVRVIDLEDAGYLPVGATRLDGPYAHAYSDLNDDDWRGGVEPDAGEEVGRTSGGFDFAFVPAASCPGGPLAPTAKCTWDPASLNSWQTNRKQNAVQAFALVNRFRDHLQQPPIGFDGFADGGPGGDDPVIVQTRDGAATAGPVGTPQRPNQDHRNNANMTTLPEGLSPRMQMYLFAGPDFRAIDGGDDAATVWHEYAHGLSGRLITTDGTSALASAHGGALGEGWSDFYALDLLHRDGLEIDYPAIAGQVDIGAYSDVTPHATRSQGADCSASNPSPAYSPAAACPGTPGAGSGGYTLGDFGRIAAGPEVHADGEIWLETLWDLRRGLIDDLRSVTAGSDAVERLVTDGMRLTPPEPSFIDARDAIVAADIAAGGAHRDRIWAVFAARGMGCGAEARDANDPAPTQDFLPRQPPCNDGPSSPGPDLAARNQEPTAVPAPSTPETPAPPAPPGLDPSAPRPAPVLRIAATGRRAASVSVRCASTCRLAATGAVSATTARRLGRPRRTVITASRTTRVATLRLSLSYATRTAARRRGVRTLRVRLRVRAVDGAGRSTTVSKTVRINL